MTIKRILFPVSTFPDPPPDRTVEGAVMLAQLLGATLTAHIPQLDDRQANWPPVVGAFPLDFPQLMREMVMQSQTHADSAAKKIGESATACGVSLDLRRAQTPLYAAGAPVMDLARLHDLVAVGVPEAGGFGAPLLQAAIFDSGRPVVLIPAQKGLQRLDRIAVAWDYSREAARAMADAMPILARAQHVDVITVFGEKSIATACTRADLDIFLGAHGVRYALHAPTLADAPIGPFLMRQARALHADMLVMGAYGHTRLREFILGGATRAILSEPQMPTFLSR